MAVTIWSIGHSTRTLDELVALLKEHQVESLIDIRAFPLSRRNPHFNREHLMQRLPEHSIMYRWLGRELGGYRKKKDPNSPHVALTSPGFRNYADYMASGDFIQGILELEDLAAQERVVMMCAEKLWWQCHRSLLSDYLAACRGVEVLHIVETGRVEAHRLHRTARLAEGHLIYDFGEQMRLL
jgi:uncharacterized protein (DUF488 family)